MRRGREGEERERGGKIIGKTKYMYESIQMDIYYVHTFDCGDWLPAGGAGGLTSNL